MKLDAVYRSHVGLVRSNNQDAVLCLPASGWFLVADGMGGEQAGEEASAQVVATVQATADAFAKSLPADPIQAETRLGACLQQANQDVLAIAAAEPQKTGLGSTASLLWLHRGVLFIGHVGDSRIYLAREGRVDLITNDHSLVWVLHQQGALTRAEMDAHPDRNLLTRSIGSKREIDVDTHQRQFKAGDLFLLCSDGLTSHVTEAEIFALLNASDTSLDSMADALIQAALDAGGGDNISVVLLRVLELDATDDWTPENTAHLKLGYASSAASEETRRLGDIPTQILGHKRGHRVRYILAALVVLMLGGIAYCLLRSSAVVVPLGVANQQEITLLEVKTAQGQTLQPEVLVGERGPYLKLNGASEYHLRVQRAGHVLQTLTVAGNAGTASLKEWVPLAQLTLILPPEQQIATLSVASEQKGDSSTSENRVWRAPDLNGRSELVVSLDPFVTYSIMAQSAGGATFSRRMELPPRGDRTIRIFFSPNGNQAP